MHHSKNTFIKITLIYVGLFIKYKTLVYISIIKYVFPILPGMRYLNSWDTIWFIGYVQPNILCIYSILSNGDLSSPNSLWWIFMCCPFTYPLSLSHDHSDQISHIAKPLIKTRNLEWLWVIYDLILDIFLNKIHHIDRQFY